MTRSDALANRKRIIEAARTVFAESGYDAEMKEIAARADLGVGTIYRNYPSKTDLLLDLLRTAQEETLSAFDHAEQCPGVIDGLREVLEQLLLINVRYGWVMEAWTSGQGGDALRQFHASAEDDERSRAIHRILARGVTEGILRTDLDIEVTARLMFGSAFPLVHGSGRLDRPLQELASAVISLLLDGARDHVLRHP